MTRNDAPKYSAKHPAGTPYDQTVADVLSRRSEDGRIACADAFDIARELSLAPAEIGRTADLLEYRITRCQLGLFGYSPEKKIVEPAHEVPDAVREQLDRFTIDGTISCVAAWKIADSLGMEWMAVAAVCELLELKIQPCQLGAF